MTSFNDEMASDADADFDADPDDDAASHQESLSTPKRKMAKLIKFEMGDEL